MKLSAIIQLCADQISALHNVRMGMVLNPSKSAECAVLLSQMSIWSSAGEVAMRARQELQNSCSHESEKFKSYFGGDRVLATCAHCEHVRKLEETERYYHLIDQSPNPLKDVLTGVIQ